MFGWSSFAVFCVFSLLLGDGAAANTEIINFKSDLQHSVDLPQAVVGNWATLNSSLNERRWAVQPAPLGTPLHEVCETDVKSTSASPVACPHELWITLDLDDANWRDYGAFTLRLSWAASTPADFLIELYSPETVSTFLSNNQQQQRQITLSEGAPSFREGPPLITRTKYARIRVVDAGVPTPQIQLDRPKPRSSDRVVEPIHFILILEQLYWGFLPASQLPTICFLIPVLLAAAMAVPRLLAYLDPLVLQAREDLANRASLEKEE